MSPGSPSISPPRPAKRGEGWGEGHAAGSDPSSQPSPRRTGEKGYRFGFLG
jgi:hypothetical protein